MKILVAEDSTQTSMILQSAIEGLGHECLVAADGAAAWELFQQQSDLQVVLSDWLMPRMDGRELCRRIRESDRADTYFIFLTTLEDKLHILEGERAGADAYLTKPVEYEALRSALERAEQQLDRLRQAVPVEGQDRHEVVQQLLKMGQRMTTRVTVNDRSLTLDAAVKLIEGLPPESRIGRRWPRIWIEPDPFVEAGGPSPPPSSADLQRRRVEHGAQAEMLGRLAQGVRRQDEAEAAAAAQRAPWWRKLVGRRD
jgi:CheY-like chemotaxis protein